ncbi:MAG: thioredoxin domain-containing protein [Candidatus Omnitrophica bacterium]|nr:thioredoxin domain-containing protein [Candidatus Omnitrophota bacterium]
MPEEKKVLNYILIIILGVVFGATIATIQSNTQKILVQQKSIHDSQARLEKKLSGTGSELGTNAEVRIALLEKRMADLEGQWKEIKEALQGMRRPNQEPQMPSEDFTKAYDIPVDHSVIRGKKDAPITITEFLDFQCPFCSRSFSLMLEVLKAYPDKVNYVLKHYPLSFHPNAKPASKAALAAGEQGKYNEMVELLLKNAAELSDAKYKDLAKELGLNVDKFDQDLKNKDAQYEQYISQDMELGNKVDVRGTPTFFLNGKKTKARSLDSFKKEIDEILNNKK